jgi:hypothetical protein
MLAPTPTVATWPIAGDVPDLLKIVQDQAQTIADKEALLHAYQNALNVAQTAPVVVSTATGVATGTSLTLSAVTGTVQIGSVLAGPTGTVPDGTTILNQQSGTTGGAGTYTTSVATTVANAAVTLTYQPPGINPAWPLNNSNPNALMVIVADQTALLRSQTMALQQYQTLLNDSGTTPPASGP